MASYQSFRSVFFQPISQVYFLVDNPSWTTITYEEVSSYSIYNSYITDLYRPALSSTQVSLLTVSPQGTPKKIRIDLFTPFFLRHKRSTIRCSNTGAHIWTGQKTFFLHKWTGQKILDVSDWTSPTKTKQKDKRGRTTHISPRPYMRRPLYNN